MTWGFILLCLLGIVLFLVGILVANKYITEGLEKDIQEAEDRRKEFRDATIIELGHSPAPPGYIVERMSHQPDGVTDSAGSHTHSMDKWQWHSEKHGTHSGFNSRYEAVEDAWGCFYRMKDHHEGYRATTSLASERRA